MMALNGIYLYHCVNNNGLLVVCPYPSSVEQLAATYELSRRTHHE